ncbi:MULTISPECIES: alanine racemase [unclassified Clostridium]|uniref:alanine racemase n=1 Tax=unclassified Clostridium TaxID=2614128 RepID=UPI003216F6E6
MEKIMRPVWAEINLDTIATNTKNIKKLIGDKELIAIVKADCYGHGAVDVVPTLLESGASRLAVAMLTEAIELRENNINAPIVILGYTPLYLGEELINYDIEQTVYDLDYAKELSKIAISLNKKAKIHIAIDTGMGRIGFLPGDDTVKTINEVYNLEGLEVIGIYSHFSTSDEKDKTYTNEQLYKFKKVMADLETLGIEIPLKHISNSGAIIDMPETYLNGVRPGIILYGYYPSKEVSKDNISVKPALTLKAKIAHVKELHKDMYISYGKTFKTNKKTIVATLPIGYGDGYPRALSENAKVIVNGKFASILGRICMDQCMIDVTDIENVKTGDEVIILGVEGDLKFNADDMAEALGTINYEILCRIKSRIPRVYIKNKEIVKVRNNI